MSEFLSAVSTIGFPAACCFFLLWQNKVQDERNAAQVDKMNEILQQNTAALQELSFYIKNGGEGK